MKPELTIAIATLGRESLFMTLDSIIKNKGNHNIEIIIIGKFSGESYEKVSSYLKNPFIRLINKSFPVGDLSEKRNLALKEARADIVAFCDDDVKITPFWIDEGLNSFKRYKNVGIVSGPSLNPREGSWISQILGDTLSSISAGAPSARYNIGKKEFVDKKGDKLIGCNFFVSKDIVKKIGYFNPKMIPGEEIDFATRAIKNNYLVIINPRMYLYHFARPTIKKFIIQNFRFGYSRIRMMRENVQKELIYLIPLLWFSFLVIFLLFSFFSRLSFYILRLYLAVYLTFVLFSSILSMVRNRSLLSFLIMFTIPIMHISYALGELKELFIPGKDFRSS